MGHIAAALLLSVLLFHVVIGEEQKVHSRDKRSNDVSKTDTRRAKRAIPHEALINPADLGMRLKIRRSDPYRRAPRMKRYRRMAEDAEMFKRGVLDGGRHIRVKKASKA